LEKKIEEVDPIQYSRVPWIVRHPWVIFFSELPSAFPGQFFFIGCTMHVGPISGINFRLGDALVPKQQVLWRGSRLMTS
jgi:hypothetical protein